MPTVPLSRRLTDEDCQRYAEAFRRYGSKNEAAKALGIDRTTYRRWLNEAARRGFCGTKPVLPGFTIKQTSAQIGAGGQIEREWVQQRPEPGDEFAPPEGHKVKGVSALVDAQGRVIQQWVKTRSEDRTDDLVEALKATFEAYRGPATLPPAPAGTDQDLATFYNIADHHLGLFAWARETGEDYDLKIGEATLLDAMARLVANAPNSSRAVVLNLGDFFHADSPENRTARSGNALDVDTRYAKVLQVGVRLMIDCIDLALQKHDHVRVRCLPGNHDSNTALALSVALAAFYRESPRVEVDTDPSRFFWWRFGKVFVGATHGDMVKPDDMPGVMASYRARDWGESEFRYAYFGHVHHRSRGGGEKHGVVWETFQSLAAKDAWHSASGYSSGRSMVAITHHRDQGEVFRHTVSARMPRGGNLGIR